MSALIPRLRQQLPAFALAALVCTVALPSAARSDKEIAQLLEQFSDDKKAAGALEQVVAIGHPAVNQLQGLAMENQDVVKRGWAIAALTMIGGARSDSILKEVHDDPTTPPLVREWAMAGRLNLATDIDGLLAVRKASLGRPALNRPFRKRLEGLLKREDQSLDGLIKVAAVDWQLRNAVGPTIVKAPPAKLVKVLWTAKDNNTRQMMASFVATQATTGQSEGVAEALLKSVRFDPKAGQVPWAGGALFIPSFTWPKGQAREFADELLTWMVWADGKANKKDEVRQVGNNLQSVGFGSQAGYGRSRGNAQDPKMWVRVWASVFSAADARRVVKAAGRRPREFGL